MLKLRLGSITKLKTAGDIFQTDARFGASHGAKTRTRIADGHMKRAGLQGRAKTDRPAFDLGRDRVLDRVFDQRLDGEDRDRDA